MTSRTTAAILWLLLATGLSALTQTRNADGSVTLSWETVPGGWYQVEWSVDLAEWRLLGNSEKAVATSRTWTDDGGLTGSHPAGVLRRFYRIRDWGVFNVTFSGTSFTYTDARRTVAGIFVKPAGGGPFPAVVINHGTGGTATGFSLQRANEMSPWGLACIGATLTHSQGETEDLATWGFSPENTARIQACQAVLSTRADVDLNRCAMWGHSRGAFAATGAAALMKVPLKALGVSAGGILEDGSPETTYPTVSDVLPLRAPAILFHGAGDTVVPPENSLRLQNRLTSQGVENERVVFDTAGLSTGARHNLHQTPAINSDMLARWRAWLVSRGVLP